LLDALKLVVSALIFLWVIDEEPVVFAVGRHAILTDTAAWFNERSAPAVGEAWELRIPNRVVAEAVPDVRDGEGVAVGLSKWPQLAGCFLGLDVQSNDVRWR
jgi:hypothetical protein